MRENVSRESTPSVTKATQCQKSPPWPPTLPGIKAKTVVAPADIAKASSNTRRIHFLIAGA